MLEPTDRWVTFDRRWEARRYATRRFRESLARFAALWMEARLLKEDPGGDWRDDLEPDLAVARAVNGLPPA